MTPETEQHLRVAMRHLWEAGAALAESPRAQDRLDADRIRVARRDILVVAGRKVCPQCREEFMALSRRAGAIYCSETCSDRHAAAQARRRAKEES